MHVILVIERAVRILLRISMSVIFLRTSPTSLDANGFQEIVSTS